MIKHYIILVPLVFIFLHLSFAVHDQFTVKVLAFKACKGPKRMNCTVVALKTLNNNTIIYDVLVKQNVALTYGRVVGRSADNKVLPFQMKKPCDHYIIRQTLVTFLKVTDDCVLKKNHYVFSVNLKDLIRMNSQLIEYELGEWSYQTVFYGNNCNVLRKL